MLRQQKESGACRSFFSVFHGVYGKKMEKRGKKPENRLFSPKNVL
jgi:hypothetical protein